MKEEDYNYKKITMILDMDEQSDREIMEWLDAHKSKRNNYSVQLREAVRKLIEDTREMESE